MNIQICHFFVISKVLSKHAIEITQVKVKKETTKNFIYHLKSQAQVLNF